ncbi:MAG: hypothetical protein ACE5JH_09655 [Acidobacteriota bacterium]
MIGRSRAAGLLSAACCVVGAAACYATHEYSDGRQSRAIGLGGSLSLRLEVAAGRSAIGHGDPDRLYDLRMRYCGNHFAPRLWRGADGDRVLFRAGLKRLRRSDDGTAPPGGERNDIDLLLGPAVPIDLSLELGEGRHVAELGGLRLTRLDVATDAGATTISFSEPLIGGLGVFTLSGGPGRLNVSGLGHAAPSHFTLDAGDGEFMIDLSGDWRGQPVLHIDVRLGDVTLMIPRALGVELTASRPDSGDLALAGFRLENGTYRKPGLDAALPTIAIRVGEGLGTVTARLTD